MPTLMANNIVVMDHLWAHKLSDVRESIDAVSACLVYLPPSSPDYLPIDSYWSKLRTTPRRTEVRSRAVLVEAHQTGHELSQRFSHQSLVQALRMCLMLI